MMWKRALWVAVGMVVVCSAVQTWAAPNVMRYQGRLTNAAGQPISTATEVTFTFYDAATGGTQLTSFSDTDTVTPNADGIYSTLVGDVAPDPPLEIPAEVFGGNSVFLDVSVGGESLLPRMQVTSSAYALTAGSAAQISTRSFLTAESINVGDLVALDASGMLHKAAVAALHPAQFQAGYAGIIGAVLVDSSHAVIIYQDSNNSWYATAVVATISGGGITFGTPVTLQTSGDYAEQVAVTSLGGNKVLLLYTAPGQMATGLVGTVSGDALSLGSPANFGGSIYQIIACPLDTDKALVVLRAGACNAYVATASGTDLVFGDPQLIFWSDHFAAVQMATNQVLAVCDGADVVLTANGDTLDQGPQGWFNGPNGQSGLTLTRLDSERVLLADAGEQGLAMVVDVSSGTPVAGYAYILSTSPVGPVYATTLSADKVLLTYGDSYAGWSKAVVARLQGSAITFKSPNYVDSVPTDVVPLALDSERALLAYSSPNGEALLFTPPSYGLAQYVGVAEESVGESALCRVTVGGGITRQFSGLIPGETYYVTESGPSEVPSQADTVVAGRAIGTDELVVRY